MPSQPVHIRSLAIFGVGLIGGSLALRLKQEGIVDRIIGVGRTKLNLERAQSLGAIDEIQTDPVQAVRDADVVLLATPVDTIVDLLHTIAPAVNNTKIITDVGSVKYGIVNAAKAALGVHFDRFVPGHPVAGKEKSGIDAATDDLFENHKVILTPVDQTDKGSCDLIAELWKTTGAQVIQMDAQNHDCVLSITSHLPHVLAYVMMDFLSQSQDRESCYEMAAGGFYDFTRTASSDPEMWRDISIMNGVQLREHIAEYQNRLDEVSDMIRVNDEKGLQDLFAAAKQARTLVTEKRKALR